ncbi:hypothetical protein Ais01nite_64810 [Asanoa ishikariensis]|uniref:Uncharacterized protein n=1 Tax=Asanoa ishikariensis TaxID=137265 RepID=A0A1H3NQU1_9ACTN|nr:hypothetical protein [Asanoa ishikariensis]GIF68446.1 hypothetical protein Ais01nite_64810 [Asanoa ishikariensis]SDY91050.1 hypothetical protein SAMN05421684_2242 [Asanoa ishikariensis]
MGVWWRDSPAKLVELLRRRGLDPDRVDDVEAAWQAFREFLAVPVDGLEADPDADSDGWIIQWGRYSWHDNLPSLGFTRQFGVGDHQPEYWQVSLELVFSDGPAIDQLHAQDTGFDFSAQGQEQDAALSEAERELHHDPALQALWKSTPTRSAITLERAG